MTYKLTILEEASLNIFLKIIERFAAGKRLSNWTYQEMMGEIRDMVRRLQNPQFACPTGQHVRPSGCPCRKTEAA